VSARRRTVQVRRVYDLPRSDDGIRVLVDRLWPRGVSKAAARFDQWCPQIAPSTQLRRWYGHDPTLFDEFTVRYVAELGAAARSRALAGLVSIAGRGMLTLLTATRDVAISEAAVLAAYISSDAAFDRADSGHRPG
jgi:uncharacterized protein YeaO (DUF488 family)